MNTPVNLRAVRATDASDAEVIAAVLAGDVERFAFLVRRHNQAMFRACRAVLRDDAEAEDAVQTAWVNAYRALSSFRADAQFRTWAMRIAIHEASARLRHRQRLSIVPLEEAMTEAVTEAMTAGSDPERGAMAEELGRALERHIDALPDGMRSVLVLRDVIELDTAETAACLGIGEEAVRVRLHRARQAIAQTMQAAMGDALERAAPKAWQFDGERCARVEAHVMAAITR